MPLDQTYQLPPRQKIEYDPVPEGIYQVEISDIKLAQRQAYNKPEVTEDVLDFEFVILDEGDCRGRRLWKKVRPVMNPGDTNFRPSYLYTLASKATQKQAFTPEECLTFSPNSLIGKQVLVTVDAKAGKDGRIWNNIQAFTIARTNLDPFEKSEPPQGGNGQTPVEAEDATPDVNDMSDPKMRAFAGQEAPAGEINVEEVALE